MTPQINQRDQNGLKQGLWKEKEGEGHYINGGREGEWLKYWPSGELKSQSWFSNNKLHKEGAPASISYYKDGTPAGEAWFIEGKPHRVGGPAWKVNFTSGAPQTEFWYIKNKLHRIEGPAEIYYSPEGNIVKETHRRKGDLFRKAAPAFIEYDTDGLPLLQGWALPDNYKKNLDFKGESISDPLYPIEITQALVKLTGQKKFQEIGDPLGNSLFLLIELIGREGVLQILK